MKEKINSINAELREKINELERANNDLTNLMNSTEIATIFLDMNMALRRFTPAAKKLFNLISSDVGSPIDKLSMRFCDKDLKHEALKVLETQVTLSKEVKTNDKQWFVRRILPFHTHDNRLDGLVLTFTNVTELKQKEENLQQSKRRLGQAQKIIHVGHWDWYTHNNQLIWSNEVYHIFAQDPTTFHVTPENFEKTIHPDDYEAFIIERKNALQEKRDINMVHRIVLPSGAIRDVHEMAEIILDDNGDVIQVSGTVQDITKYRDVEKKLKRTLDATTDAIWEWNFKTNELAFSPKYYKMLGYQPDEFPPTYENWMALIHPDDKKRAMTVASDYLKTKRYQYKNEFRMKTKDNQYRWILAKARVVERDADGCAVLMIGNHEDITERKKMLDTLNLLTEAVDHSLAGFDMVDDKLKFIYMNKAYVNMWGYDTAEEILGTSPVDHCADKHMLEKIIEHVDKNGAGEFEFVAKRKNGSFFDVFMRVSVITDNEGKRYYHAFSLDISDRNADAKRLKEYAEEQKLLVREIHHRVKNNLEVIISLIEMRAKSIKDPSLQLIFKEIKERIWAIAYVHKNLYDSESFLHIDFKSYLEHLTYEIAKLYGRSDVDIRHNFQNVQIDIDTAIPCSLAYIEMISNAFKHAFPMQKSENKHSGFSRTIHASFNVKPDSYSLIVKDNGKGLPPEMNWNNPKSIGFRLIRILTRQLDGVLKINSAGKTEILLTFPRRNNKNNSPKD